ncbi:transposase [Paraburkholderia tropica]|uniref:transposase n=1 Tax=Paraburkholderia tropica TaxID=92647 RepID=UPI0022B2496D|nr:transposase [Paraburkholderia tropica]
MLRYAVRLSSDSSHWQNRILRPIRRTSYARATNARLAFRNRGWQAWLVRLCGGQAQCASHSGHTRRSKAACFNARSTVRHDDRCRARNFTPNKITKRLEQIEQRIQRHRRIRRWEHEAVLEAMQSRLDRQLDAMTMRRRTVEHVFGTLKHWMGTTHFQTRGLGHVAAEMSLHVLAYNLKRVIRILGFAKTMRAMKLAGA